MFGLMRSTTSHGRVARLLVALVTVAIGIVGLAGVAAAHTDFDSSAPADGDVVDGPLDVVVLNFTNPAEPAGDGFELLGPDGTIRSPSSIDETDGTSFVLSFDPPLAAGTYGVRWSVRAGDAHPIEGSFRFEVTGTPDPAGGATATTVAPASGADDMAGMGHTDGTAGMEDMDAAAHAAMSDDPLEEFLAVGSADDAVPVGRSGRIATMLGTVFGVGVLAALIWTVRGSRDELVSLLTWVRLAGLVIATGGLIEYAALVEADPSASFGASLSTKPGVAAALKVVGGLVVLFGFHTRAGRIAGPTPSLSAAVATELPSGTADVRAARAPDAEHRWTPTATAAAGIFGYALVLASFWFDGHTVSRGPWAVHSFVNLVHLGAAAAWGGGVFAMTTVAWMRHRRSDRVRMAEMVVRFSSTAAVSLVAVIVAGLVMTWMVIDTPGDLFDTDWGRILLAKTAVVAVAAGLGGYNHFRLKPALEQRPDDPQLAKELRVSLSIESVAFVVVTVLTAILVASAI